jgi:outer membrane protein assembly factor BamA
LAGALAVLAAAGVPALFVAAGANAQEVPTVEDVSSLEEVPSLGDLERMGATIGGIGLDIENVFDLSDPGEDKRLYRWANRVHRTTRPSVVEDILLFESGEPLLEQVLDETARILRERGFVADAEVTASRYDAARNTADVKVWIRDAWSLEPDLKYSRGGGENEYALGLVEDNMFGLGKSMTLSYSSDIDRDMRFFSYEDDNLLRSRKQLRAAIADMSDGRQFRFSAGRPFFSFDTRWSVLGETLDDQRVDSIYDLGEEIDEFRHDTRYVSVYGGRSRGISDGVTKRWIAGLSFEEDEFQETPGFGPPLLLPENRRLIYPWAGWQWIGDDYRQVSELNDMGRIEDISLGLNLYARVGVASPKLDSDRRAVLLDFSAERGWEPFGPGSLFMFSSSATSRVEHGEYLNSRISLSASFMQRNLGDELFLASLSTVLANNLDAENQVLLGGDNGLRGYPLRYQSGERSAILSLEQRFYTDWYPFRLIRVGYAFFFDAGRVWGEDPRNTPNLGTLYDVGVGLRLTSPRSSGRAVVHLDLAFPINAPADIDDIQIVIEKRSSF